MALLPGVNRIGFHLFLCTWEIPYFLVLAIAAVASRKLNRKIDIGIGPEPLINNVYHKKALLGAGFTCETFVDTTWHITSDFDKSFQAESKFKAIAQQIFCPMFWHVIKNYRAIYIYFNGGPLYKTKILWRFEPILLALAGIKSVVMPYGGDVQHLGGTRNFYFKYCMIADYPETYKRNSRVKKQIDLWTQSKAYIISGCDWVDYTYHWDKLMISHFSIDCDMIEELSRGQESDCSFPVEFSKCTPMKILHAPNHRNLKGTYHILSAVQGLKQQGFSIELTLLEKASNWEVLSQMRRTHLVVDQLVVGWYAMFAIEAMMMQRPVICYLRKDLLRLYTSSGLLQRDELPIISADSLSFEAVLKRLYCNPRELWGLGEMGRHYVRRHHSLEYIGSVFADINKLLGIVPELMAS